VEQAADAIIFADRSGAIRVGIAALKPSLDILSQMQGCNLDVIIRAIAKRPLAGFHRAIDTGRPSTATG
jgi:hypothetical protein